MSQQSNQVRLLPGLDRIQEARYRNQKIYWYYKLQAAEPIFPIAADSNRKLIIFKIFIKKLPTKRKNSPNLYMKIIKRMF